ncbi:MAG: CRTAC1 family protein [Chloroflexi bacterium]|nr:CRTAC1 family protein [Chloroflexota bacterium]MBP8055302.1 CRTAC1 family protein [Chloroflexota bacterium]
MTHLPCRLGRLVPWLLLILMLAACTPSPVETDQVTPVATVTVAGVEPTSAMWLGRPLAAASPSTSPTLFTNVNGTAGIAAARQDTTEKLIGQAWGDYDRDGWLDLYVTDSGGPNTLFRNNGDGTFAVSPLSANVSLPEAVSSGVTFADYDNDGWPDLYVLNWGENTLYHNDGGAGFTDVTASAGVGDIGQGKSAAWGDYDEDGFLDLYVANWACYPDCGRPSSGDRDRLYHNNGDGTFTDISSALSGKMMGAGFAVSFTDYDNDGDLDIYLVNDEFINPVGNALWRNDGPGCEAWCFTDVSTESGTNTTVMGMGLATADYDNDGDMDFYFSNAGPMTLLQNVGDGTFVNAAAAAGVDLSTNVIAWGVTFFDYDNDGWSDLYVAVSDRAAGEAPRDVLFHNNGDGTFSELPNAGLDEGGGTLGVAYGDYDRDGWVDLVVGNFDQGYVLYRNAAANSGNNRLVFDLVGGGPVNRDAVGTKVAIRTPDGRTQLQELHNGSSLGAGNMLTLNFGLGAAAYASVTITWPDGTVQTYPAVPANYHYTFTYPTTP